MIYDAFLQGRFPIKLMKPVDREYFNPSYEEFKPKTLEFGERFHHRIQTTETDSDVPSDRAARNLYENVTPQPAHV